MVSRYRRCDREAFQSPLETELQAIQLSPYRAGLAEPNLQRLPVASASTACFCPVGLSPAGKPLTQGSGCSEHPPFWERDQLRAGHGARANESDLPPELHWEQNVGRLPRRPRPGRG